MIKEDELRRYLNVIKRAVALIEGMLENDDGGMMEQLLAPPIPVKSIEPVLEPQPIHQETAKLPPAETSAARKKHIGDLLGIDCWPESVPAFLVNAQISDEDQINRANAVLDMMVDRNIEGGTFLDFGCGEGWIAQEAAKRGVIECMGYDIVPDDNWNKRLDVRFSSNFENLPKEHFNFVMLYDVLDHCQDPVETMSQVRSVLKPGGAVFVRCHPWPSKHAMHLYKQGLNQAYFHLFLTWHELREILKVDPIFTRAEKKPIEAYHWWFNNFRIVKERFVREEVSEFFHVPSFKELLANEQQIPMNEIDAFLETMKISFVDYVLEK